MKTGEFEIFAKTFYGLENVLASELENIGVKKISKSIRGVKFRGDNNLLYKANYNIRTSLCFLRLLFSFKARNSNVFYNNIYNYPWEEIFGINKTIKIESTVNSNFFQHSKYIALKTKDAVVDRYRKHEGQRPNVNTESPDIIIHVHISHDSCNIYLNSSGEPLYKRGYRVDQYKAPLNEVLAAGMIYLSNWDKNKPLIDPMCGSGTILLEGAMIALNMPPGKFRKGFSFQHWNDFDNSLFKKVTFDQGIDVKGNPKLIGGDISSEAIKSAFKNINSSNLGEFITLEKNNFFEVASPVKEGLIITNPPYGKRILEDDIIEFYKKIGNQLKKYYDGFDAWIISSNLEAIKFVGLKPEKKIVLFNGPLECRYNRYSIYQGSKRSSKLNFEG